MAKLWLTYAWVDNDDGDVDYVAQQLQAVGVEVQIDRQQIRAGLRLWEQIDHFISDQSECDAWMIYATENSLSSEPCKEELAIALDRALTVRGQTFPLIGLFPETVDRELIPSPIRTRLYVSLTDPYWVERVKAATEGRSPRIDGHEISPYHLQVYPNSVRKGRGHSIEVRPRGGAWAPFLAGVPIEERDVVNPSLMYGPAGRVPTNSVMQGSRRGPDPANQWWVTGADNQASPTMSFYINCDRLPSKLVFGVYGGQQFIVQIR